MNHRRRQEEEANRCRIQKATLRGIVIGMLMCGRTPSNIGYNLGISRGSVYHWQYRWEEEGFLVDSHRPGGPKSTTPEQDRAIIQEVESNHFTNAEIIRETVRNQHQLNASTTTTVRRRLHAEGIHHRTPAKNDKLTAEHKRRRLEFAQEFVNEDLDLWSRVIFSDEKTFSSSNHGKIHCWRNDTRFDEENIYTEARSGHAGVDQSQLYGRAD
ncbi:uncharacterized protein [Palaemon carinicauda]|uniref:uncharacterized protein n=1 Tax=Palaemon carinicauda TaxID=392227 RepID=UPI0035B632DC